MLIWDVTVKDVEAGETAILFNVLVKFPKNMVNYWTTMRRLFNMPFPF